MNANPEVVVRMECCSKSYRRGPEVVTALADATITLSGGELVALVGPSGSGKTTLLNVLVGWEQPDTGHVVWPARPNPSSPLRWHEVGILPQRLGLLEELTIRENIQVPLMLSPTRPPADDLIATLGLSDVTDRFPEEVSLGEQQRAAIARALVLAPPLVVLDEPTGHQDEQSAAVVLDTLQRASRRGSTCLVATHAVDAIAIADRVLHIRDGRVYGPGRTAAPLP